MPRPVENAILHKLSAANNIKFNEVMLLKQIELPQKLPVRSCTKPASQLSQRADPLSGMYDVADAVKPLVGCAEVGVAAKHRIMKKTGASVCADVPVCNQTLYELSVDAAFWVVYDLLDFQFVISHGFIPFSILRVQSVILNDY